jgi:hypothetical protein
MMFAYELKKGAACTLIWPKKFMQQVEWTQSSKIKDYGSMQYLVGAVVLVHMSVSDRAEIWEKNYISQP